MNANPSYFPNYAEHKALVMKGIQASISTRVNAGIDLHLWHKNEGIVVVTPCHFNAALFELSSPYPDLQ